MAFLQKVFWSRKSRSIQCLLSTSSVLQVDIKNKSTFVDMSNYITNGEWELIKCKIVRNEVIYPIGDAVYPDVTITIIMHRSVLK